MNNRNSLLGRSRPADRLSKTNREALDRATAEPAPKPPPAAKTPAPTPAPSNAGKEGKVRKDELKFHWTTECPACGFKVGQRRPQARAAPCQVRTLQTRYLPQGKIDSK